MTHVDIADTKGFYKDDSLDQEGGGAYEQELNAGTTPNKTTYREHDSILETVNLQDPRGLRAGIQIRQGARGTEISRVEYDARHEAALYLVNREFNTPTAERANGRMDDAVYKAGEWQGKTVDDIIKYIVDQTGGKLAYDGSAPREYAGPITFRNTPAPQAISQVLEQEGNNLWTVLEDGFTVTVVNRLPDGDPVGEVGINVMEQSLTGAEVKTDRPARVTDRDGRGMKTQHGGPAYVGRDHPVGETYGAPPPLELEIDLSDLARAAGGAGKVSEAYKFTRHAEDGAAGWHFPRDDKNQPVKAQVRLVQKGVMRDDGVTRRAPGEPGYVEPKGFAPRLLTHPNVGMAFEAKVAGAPIFYKKQIVLASKIEAVRSAYREVIQKANGRITKEISDSPTLRKATLLIIESPVFNRKDDAGTVAPHMAIAIVALFEPEWAFLNGHVDLDAGELVIDAGNSSQFHNLVSATSFGAGQAVEIGWTFNPAHGSNVGPDNPVPLIKVRFAEAARKATFVAHVVTTEELVPEVFPGGGKPPFGAIEAGDYQKHNVIENAARVPGHLEPLAAPRNDTPRMKKRAENLASTLELPAMARGSITIFPGDESLRIGQPANGGVIVKIKHTYVPFFKTQFWLEGSPDIDSFERKHWRKKIGEYEGLTQVNSAQILEQRGRSDTTGQGSAATRVSPHTHTDDQTGGTTLGEIEVSSLTIFGATPDGQPALYATCGGKGATVDLKEVVGLGRLVSGDLLLEVTEVLDDGTVMGRIYDDPKLPEIQKVEILVNGKIVAPEDAAKLVEVGDVRPIMFVEDPDPSKPPRMVIVIDETRLVCDHFHEDEDSKNVSSLVFGVESGDSELDPEYTGDLDDLFIVERRQIAPSTPGGSVPIPKDPRFQVYLAEKECRPYDERGVFVTGPHQESGGDRKLHRIGQLSDFFRYWRSYRDVNRLGARTDGIYISVDDDGRHKEDEGPLDFTTLHPDLVKITMGIKGAPLIFDHRAWNGPGGEPRGQRWKTILIADHIHHQHQCVPTPRCPNESTQVWEANLQDRGDLDDILTVHQARLRLFMKNYDPCKPLTIPTICDPDDRYGLITDRKARAWLADVFEYHDPEGDTRLDLKARAHFKLTKITGMAELDGPLAFIGPAKNEPIPLGEGPEYLYGYLVLDRTRPLCGGKGTWYVEIPFDPLDSTGISTLVEALMENISAVNEAQHTNAITLGACHADLKKCLCDEIVPHINGQLDSLRAEVAQNRQILTDIQNDLRTQIQILADNIFMVGATLGEPGLMASLTQMMLDIMGSVPVDIPAIPDPPDPQPCPCEEMSECAGPFEKPDLESPLEGSSSSEPPDPSGGGTTTLPPLTGGLSP